MKWIDMPGETPLARYLEPYKFRSLIQEQAIYCRRIDLFLDQFEGRLNEIDRAKRKAKMTAQLNSMGIHEDLDRGFDFLDKHGLWSAQKMAYVSSFFGLDAESNDMWKAYCPEGGVLLRTTHRSLQRAIGSGEDVFIQPITYVDYEKVSLMDLDMDIWFTKDHQFAWEHEVRLVAQRFPRFVRSGGDYATMSFPDHHLVPVNLKHLVEAVVLSPNASTELSLEVAELVRGRGLTAPISRSATNGP